MVYQDLYNKILLYSRNEILYSKYIKDTLNNKIFSFLIHLSIFFPINSRKDKNYQNFFDYVFLRIETDLRELGHGDMSVNKKMKIIVIKFYSILADFKNFHQLDNKKQKDILIKYFLDVSNIDDFINYFTFFFKTGHKNIDLTSLNDITPT